MKNKQFYKISFYTNNPEEAIKRLHGVPDTFKGQIDDVRVFHKVFTKQEVEKLFTEDKRCPVCPNGIHIDKPFNKEQFIKDAREVAKTFEEELWFGYLYY